MRVGALVLAGFIFFSLAGCSTVPKQPKEPKLICSGSYVASMMMVKNALADQQLKFETGSITKEAINMRADFADGRQMEIVINKINNTSSTLALRPANAKTTKDDCRAILDKIMRYCQLRKTPD